MVQTVGVCLVSSDTALLEDLSFTVERLASFRAAGAGERLPLAARDGRPDELGECALLQSVMANASRYLTARGVAPCPELRLLHYPSAAAAMENLAGLDEPLSVEFFVVDATVLAPGQSQPAELNAVLEALLTACQGRGRGQPLRLSPASVLVYLPAQAQPALHRYSHGNLQLRLLGTERQARRADLLRLLMDHLEHAHLNRLLARAMQAHLPPGRVAVEINRYMRQHWGEQWDVHYYTGSMVASLIDSLQSLQAGTAVRCFSACNEHALAVSALAAWQMFRRAYVIVVTSGMIDEFRGTLANLARAGAPGLIVCAESPRASWFAFQGTLDVDNDGHAVIAARGLPSVFISRPDEIAAQLEQAFSLLNQRANPVFVFATQPVLESRAGGGDPISPRPPPLPTGGGASAELDAVMRLINDEPVHILWQCGALSKDERELVYAVTERAGIMLADSLLHPGSVAPYCRGKRVRNYLGALAMYGFGRRVHAFMHDGDELNSPDEQCVFFLKSKLDQAATPFSEGRIKRQLRVVQVNRQARHISPFTDIALVMPVADFLRTVAARLNVAPEVLNHRRAKLDSLSRLPEAAPVDRIPTSPMTPNYFFHRLGQLVTQLIEQQGYHYLGVYDVGRGGISAVRNVPRTGPGFSGWYGRALMGDALTALPYLAAASRQNLLAFVGDGARALVPNIEHRLAGCLASNPLGSTLSVTLFYINNGVLSLIQTYLDKRYTLNGKEQVTLPPVPCEGRLASADGVVVDRHSLFAFDEDAVGEALTARGRVTIFEVAVTHNSDGDGLSLLSESAWSRQ
ncbi:MAG: decarboxylase [Candidatus Handelsmanbacteria bacterium RIFCSPLOWO2_12_FULL_64_10]|uniref:Decarboxylase n=1 Tax=Handelsmanbacteria sp. (strain RIFCSPLOWO2_12_FULL_64_10) TaxID=1817868 RepID=A0A1F6CTC1_HANXR|nr:MAG: decarboxylase [Candidatus Handelsmanbacteria bacterium RIFCSPLOWO2_12_FULL_64_10]